jgi:hypothetical protein
VLAAGRIVASLEAHDEVVRVSRLRGRHNLLLARTRTTHCDVVTHRAFEQKALLGDITNLLAEIFARNRRDVDSVAKNLAGLDLVKTQDEIHDRRLAATRTAD